MEKKQKLIALLTAGIAAVIAVALRIYELAVTIDPDTGFWQYSDPTQFIMYALLLVVLVVAFVFGSVKKQTASPTILTEPDIGTGICAALVTAAFLYDGVVGIIRLTALSADFDPYAMTLGYFIISTGFLAKIFQILFAILSAVWFGLYSADRFAGTNLCRKLGAMAINPVLWGVARLLIAFVTPIKFKNVSQLLLEILLVVFAMIFWFAFARIASGVNPDSSMWLFFFGGITAAFLGYVCALAPFILLITGQGHLIPESRPMQFVDLAFAIFATCALFNAMPKTVGLNSRDEFKEEEAPELPEGFENTKLGRGNKKKAEKLSREERAREKARLKAEAAQERAYLAAAEAATNEDGTLKDPFEDTGAGVAEVDVDAPNPGKAESFWKPVSDRDGEHFVISEEE